ncbi:MAG TPA: glycerophosphodiester phosphodiesterase [Ramlibacter sp.]|nr:glycerophosphodiester phosphodiesterase [Ramlibacter sp.]
MTNLIRAGLAFALAAAQLCAQAQPAAFDLQGHRGARGLLPENTLPGFAMALGIGVTTLELDIAISKDRELFISHDPYLNPDITRGPDGKFLEARGPLILSLTAQQVQGYDVGRIKMLVPYARTFSDQKPVDGARIPRLKELFDLVRKSGNEHVQFAIETKVFPHDPGATLDPEEFTKLLLAEVREAGMEKRVSIISFDWRTLQVVKRDAPTIPTVYITMQRPQSIDNIGADNPQGSAWTAGFQFKDYGSVPKMIKAAGGHTWSAFWRDLDAAKVKEAQSLGIKVLAWTINDSATMSQLMNMGVDGIVTDRPDLLRAEMQKRGMPLPRATPVN